MSVPFADEPLKVEVTFQDSAVSSKSPSTSKPVQL
jgi:hypothetical protein